MRNRGKMKDRKGFTLIELVMVIVILGILAAVAIPRYFNLANRANDAAEQGVVGGVRAGIQTAFANAVPPAYPATLDGLASGTTCNSTNPCFVTVLAQGGITDSAWVETTHGGAAVSSVYTHTGTNVSTYRYCPTDTAPSCTEAGSFLCFGAACP